MTIYACSSNPGKLREFSLAGRESSISDLDIRPLPGLAHISPPDENGSTFEQNAAAKAVYYSRYSDELVLADDSGLVVPALGDAPGIYSSRYAGPDATSADNNALLLRNLSGIENRSAYFVCVVALASFGQVLTTCRGTVEGQILHEAAGTHGFGYDPLFFYPPLNVTFAALEDRQKFAVSHRGAALRNLFLWLGRSHQRLRRNHQSPVH
ncbi:MAG TPA: RdgB/HAM1 family non-canonical purine NTP pyrophosphatase [Bryobacteraceae bacterium]|nr:RdgB/HAM1 family non-canonical purine NTP pyrophosphatase [Bryobacteraceae bacterium]